MKLDELASRIADCKGLVDNHYFFEDGYSNDLINEVRQMLAWYLLSVLERIEKPIPMTFPQWCEAVALSRHTHDMTDAMACTLCRAFQIDPTEERHGTLMKFLSFNANHERYPHNFVVHMTTREHPDGRAYKMDSASDVYQYMIDCWYDEQ